ncbi:MAG: hypothetical protein HYX51_07380 [Chloroflexi bacterium]|nr:hypothetical protein [Chloroflexota bacterium]
MPRSHRAAVTRLERRLRCQDSEAELIRRAQSFAEAFIREVFGDEPIPNPQPLSPTPLERSHPCSE